MFTTHSLAFIFVLFTLFIASYSQIYGVGSVGGETFIAQYDKNCGLELDQPRTILKGFDVRSDGQSTISQSNGIFYINGFNSTTSKNIIVGIDLKTEQITQVIPYGSYSGLKLAYDENADLLVVTGQDTSDSNWYTDLIDPTNGTITTSFMSFNKTFIDVLGGPNTFDVKNRVQYISMGTFSDIVIGAIDLNTQKTSIAEDSTNMETMFYDANSDTVYGVGLQATNEFQAQRTLVSFTSSNPTPAQYANITGDWYMIYGSSSVMSQGSPSYLYSIMSIGKSSDLAFLAGVNSQTGVTETAAYVGSNFGPRTPWAFEYYYN